MDINLFLWIVNTGICHSDLFKLCTLESEFSGWLLTISYHAFVHSPIVFYTSCCTACFYFGICSKQLGQMSESLFLILQSLIGYMAQCSTSFPITITSKDFVLLWKAFYFYSIIYGVIQYLSSFTSKTSSKVIKDPYIVFTAFFY